MELIGLLLEGLFHAFSVIVIFLWSIFKWPIIIFGIILVIAFICGLVKGNDKDGKNDKGAKKVK